MTHTVKVADVCVCGHWRSEHEGSGMECTVGWGGYGDDPPGTDPCECEGYVFDYELMEDVP